jgi:hypothetical protein
MRRLRLGSIRTLLRDRYRGPRLPDDDAGRDDLRELLMQESLSPCAAEIKMRNAIRTWAPWMPETERQGLIEDICRTPLNERRRTSQDAGRRLGVTNAQRERLRLWTIYPHDMSEGEMKKWRRAKDRARKRKRRERKGAKPHASSLSRTQPWVTLGICRRTYERRFRRVANCSEVILGNTADKLATPERASLPQELAIPPRREPRGLGELRGPKGPTGPREPRERTRLEPVATVPRDVRTNLRQGVLQALRTHLSHGPVGKFLCERIRTTGVSMLGGETPGRFETAPGDLGIIPGGIRDRTTRAIGFDMPSWWYCKSVGENQAAVEYVRQGAAQERSP